MLFSLTEFREKTGHNVRTKNNTTHFNCSCCCCSHENFKQCMTQFFSWWLTIQLQAIEWRSWLPYSAEINGAYGFVFGEGAAFVDEMNVGKCSLEMISSWIDVAMIDVPANVHMTWFLFISCGDKNHWGVHHDPEDWAWAPRTPRCNIFGPLSTSVGILNWMQSSSRSHCINFDVCGPFTISCDAAPLIKWCRREDAIGKYLIFSVWIS